MAYTDLFGGKLTLGWFAMTFLDNIYVAVSLDSIVHNFFYILYKLYRVKSTTLWIGYDLKIWYYM